MTRSGADVVLRYVQHLAVDRATAQAADSELLGRFAKRHDEAAFTALVRRHGAMVYHVCRRTLGHTHDAEDACQATFLALAARAGSGRWRESVAGWLHEAARRIALKARTAAARRQQREGQAEARMAGTPLDEITARELQEALDEELARLPEKYRAPLVLCYLEGTTRDEAARRLGWPTSTLKLRIERGRELLRQRFVKRGMSLSAALGAVALTGGPVPAALLQASARAALLPGNASPHILALVRAGLHTLPLPRLKVVAALILVLSLVGGVTGYRLSTKGPQPQVAPLRTGDESNTERPKPKTDHNGDPMPDGALTRLGTLRWRAPGEVETIAFAPDGKTVAAVSKWNHGLCLFDAATGKLAQRIHPPDTDFGRIAFSPDSTRLACSARLRVDDRYKEVVQVWEGSGRRKVKEVEAELIVWLGWSADNQLLAASREEGSVLFHEIMRGQVRRFKSKDRPPAMEGLYACSYAPSGKTFAAASYNVIQVWDTVTGEERCALQAKGDHIRELALSPDGRLLASMSRDSPACRDFVELWDVKTGKLTHSMAPDQEYFANVVFSPDGKTLATIGSNDVRFWDAVSGRERSRLKGVASFGQHVAFAPDSKTLATVESHSGTLHLWDVETGELKPESAGHTNQPYHVVFSPDGRRVATGGELDGTIIVWDPTTGKQLVRINRSPQWLRACAFSPDGGSLYSSWTDDKLIFFNTTTGRELRCLTLEDPDRPDTRQSGMYMHLSADGKTLVALSHYQSKKAGGPFFLELLATGWDTATGKQLFRRRHDADDFGVAVSPDARVLAASQSSGNGGPKGPTPGKGPIQFEDLATGKHLLTFPVLEGQSQPLAFSPDGRLLTTNTFGPAPAGVDGVRPGEQTQMLRVWETASAAELMTLPTKINARVAFSRDGSVLAFSGPRQEIRLWDLRRGKEVRRITGFGSDVTSLAFSPDGGQLVSGLADSTLLVWDVTQVRAARKTSGVSETEAARVWADLRGDARAAFAARGALIDSPETTLPLLKKHIAPARPPDVQRLRRLLADLDSAVFDDREKASHEVERHAELAEPLLRKALEDDPSPEVRRRVEALLGKLQGPVTSAETLRSLRAVAVLEHIGTPEARQLLQKLADGAAEARLTRDAKASLERLPRSHPEK